MNEKDVSSPALGAVTAIGALLMAWLCLDGLVSGETVNIGKYHTGMPLSGARGVALALAYGTCALSLAVFAIGCFIGDPGRQGRFMSWAKRAFIASGVVLFASLFFKG